MPQDSSFVQAIVKAELAELEYDIELHDQIYKKLIEEANQWYKHFTYLSNLDKIKQEMDKMQAT